MALSKDKTTGAKTAIKRGSLLKFQDIPCWQQDNEYILSGYRPAVPSILQSLSSLGYVHNETVNIYSHLLGSVLFAVLPVYTYRELRIYYPTTQAVDILVFSTFFYGVAICFLLSATFHILSSHSRRIAAFGNQLDYLGIVILMWGSTIPTVYYGFYCNPELQKLYCTMVWAHAA